MSRKIIFYHPAPLVENPKRGSKIRPLNMLIAFKKNGYEVETVTGGSKKRKKDINRIKSKMAGGTKFQFVYAESVSIPIPLADPHHIPIRPLQDYSFFRFLNKQNVPIGLFYRDIYWQANEFKRNNSYLEYYIKQLFYWLEWFGFKNTVDHLFLPTLGIAKYLPTHFTNEYLSALYPGFSQENTNQRNNELGLLNESILKAFYVGGIEPPYYDLRPMMKIVERTEGMKLILCCRKNEWNSLASHYEDIDFSNIKVVHADSSEIGKYYNWADIVLDVRRPEGYFKTAMPIKIIEALGYEVPVVLLEGTEAANFVKRERSGWVFKDEKEIDRFLSLLKEQKTMLIEKKNEIKKIKKRHTWEARAQEASSVLESI